MSIDFNKQIIAKTSTRQMARDIMADGEKDGEYSSPEKLFVGKVSASMWSLAIVTNHILTFLTSGGILDQTSNASGHGHHASLAITIIIDLCCAGFVGFFGIPLGLYLVRFRRGMAASYERWGVKSFRHLQVTKRMALHDATLARDSVTEGEKNFKIERQAEIEKARRELAHLETRQAERQAEITGFLATFS